MFANDSNRPAASPVRWTSPVLGIFVLLVVGGIGGIVGCGGSTSPKEEAGKPVAPSDYDLLKSAIDMMQPDRLGIDALPNRAAGLLNQWRAVRLKLDEKERLSQPLSDETRSFLKPHFSAETLERMEQDNFSPDDAQHIRTGFLMKNIALRLTKGVEGQLNQAQVLFDYVNRNVQLVDEGEALPLMPYEILALGEGMAEDRAWVFAELLRQLNIDTVIVKPVSPDPAQSATLWFAGVVVDGEIRLFDARRATPVPLGPQGDRTDLLPATPPDLSRSDVLKSLTGDDSLSPAQFDKLQIEVIGTPTLWAPRLAVLEKRLTGQNAAVIYQDLTAAANDPSAIWNRITALDAKHWKPQEIRPWSHPETRFQAHGDSDELKERWKPFLVPYPIVIDEQDQEVSVGNPTYEMLRIRTKQLQGEYKEAITGYLRIQMRQQAVPSRLSADIREAYVDAAEDAYFWTAVCQMEQETPQGAIDKFAEYIRRTERFSGSRHAEHARVLMARCLRQLDRPKEAIEALESLEPSSPQYAVAEFLKRQLAAMPMQSVSENPVPQPMETKEPQLAHPNKPQPNAGELQTPKPAIAEKPAA